MVDEISRIEQAIPFAKSTVSPEDDYPGGGPGLGFALLQWAANSKSEVPPYWSYGRDKWLRNFVYENGPLKTAVATFINKAVTIPWAIHPHDPSISRHVRTASEIRRNFVRYSGSMSSSAAKGWKTFFKAFLLDYVSADNGAFALVLGKGPSDGPIVGAPLGLMHLDASMCLGRDSRVLLPDGSTRSIQRLVEGRYDGDVMSVNAAGDLVASRVVGWHKTRLGDRHWLRVILRHGRRKQRGKEGLWVTNDHEFLTDCGWVRADQLLVGTRVCTSRKQPSPEQMEVIVGSVLGDSHLGDSSGDVLSAMQMLHCVDQGEWLGVKISALSDLGKWTLTRCRNNVSATSSASPAFTSLREKFYSEKRNIVDRELVEKHFSSRLLAVFYGDDGDLSNGHRERPGARFYTQSYSVDDSQWLADLMSRNGIETNVRMSKVASGKELPYLYVTVNGAKVLFDMISPYMPPCMRHKLPRDSKPYDPSLWSETEPATLYYDEVESVRRGDNGQQASAYCIDVEKTHNFVAGQMVVHNCIRTKSIEFPVKYRHIDGKEYKLHHTRVIEMTNMPSTDVRLNGVGLSAVSCCVEAAQELWDIYRYSGEKFGSRPPRQILYVKKGGTFSSLDKAVKAWNFKLNQEQRTHFGGTLLMGPDNARNELDLGVLPLNVEPENFNRRDVTTIDKAEIASAFGLDLRDLAYIMGAPSRTGDAEVQDRKGRGKGVGEFIETFTERFSEICINNEIFEIGFDNLDDEQDEQRSLIRDKRSQARERDLRSGVTTIRVEREKMWQTNEISQEQFDAMELLDGRLPNGLDVLLLFQSADADFTTWLALGVPDPTDVLANDAETMADAIHERMLALSEEVHVETKPERIRKARQALAALEKLKAMYLAPPEETGLVDDQTQLEAEDAGEEQPPTAPSEGGEGKGAGKKPLAIKQVEIGEDEVDAILRDYQERFRLLVERADSGDMLRQRFEEALADLVTLFLLSLFQRGSRTTYALMSRDEFAAMQSQITEHLTAIGGLTDDIYSGRYAGRPEAYVARIDNWLNIAAGTYYRGMSYRRDGALLRWERNPLKDSCIDCLGYEGQTKTAAEWRSIPAYPRMTALACYGVNCGCRFVEVSG